MMLDLRNVLWLGLKELRSIRYDRFMLLFVIYSFTFSVYSQATGLQHDLHNAAVGVVDEDHSVLSRRIAAAFLPPEFKPARYLEFAELDNALEHARVTFVVVLPAGLAADLRANRQPQIQIVIDATAMMQAGLGANYIQNIIAAEVADYLQVPRQPLPIALETRFAFNPALESGWFTGVMALINNVTMLAVLLSGAALIREREHGTIEHLLVMPLRPAEIMIAKVWANGLVIVLAVIVSLLVVIRGLVGVPLVGSPALFVGGVVLYLFFATALGIFLGTLARSMPQLGLLFILIVLPMNLLSGGNTPLESMPRLLQWVMQAVPSTHFVHFAQAILFRGAGIDVLWPRFAATFGIGMLFFAVSLYRFRRALAVTG